MFTARYDPKVITEKFICNVFQGRGMAEAVIPRVRSQISPCEICDGQSVNARSPSPDFLFPLSVSLHERSMLILICLLLLPEHQRAKTVTSKK